MQSRKPHMTLPKVLCIGAQKAGTSWLHENLKSNPGVWLPPFKEVHFFDHRFLPGHRRWIKGHVARGIRTATTNAEAKGLAGELSYLRTLSEPPLMTRNWYRRVFAPCPDGKVGIDITPEYASIPAEGVTYARKILGPDLRLIYLIRDPLERALSQLRMYIARRKRTPETAEAWERVLSEPDLMDRGNYASHIPRWEAVVPVSSILYIPFGRVPRQPHHVLEEIESFCGFPSAQYPKATEAVFRGPEVHFPREVIAQLKDLLSDQTQFLVQRFGATFLEESRGERK
jgi:Sulfotransferase family